MSSTVSAAVRAISPVSGSAARNSAAPPESRYGIDQVCAAGPSAGRIAASTSARTARRRGGGAMPGERRNRFS